MSRQGGQCLAEPCPIRARVFPWEPSCYWGAEKGVNPRPPDCWSPALQGHNHEWRVTPHGRRQQGPGCPGDTSTCLSPPRAGRMGGASWSIPSMWAGVDEQDETLQHPAARCHRLVPAGTPSTEAPVPIGAGLGVAPQHAASPHCMVPMFLDLGSAGQGQCHHQQLPPHRTLQAVFMTSAAWSWWRSPYRA